MALTKDQLVTELAEVVEVPKATSRAALEALAGIAANQLSSGEEITLPGIGKLKAVDRPARTGRNPATGAEIKIPAKRVVKFVPSKNLDETVNN